MSASPPSNLGRYREAIKILVSGLIAAWIYFSFRLPLGELAIFFPLAVMRPTVGGSRFNGTMMVLGVFCGVAAAVFASTYLLNLVPLLLLFLGVFITAVAYVGQSPRVSGFGLMAGVASLILVYAARRYSAVQANTMAFWLCVQVTIAALVFWLVSWSLWPRFARRQLRAASLDLLDFSKRLGSLILGTFARGETSRDELRALYKEARNLRRRYAPLLDDAKSEAACPGRGLNQPVQYYALALDLQRQIGLIGGQLADRPDDPSLKALAPRLADVASALERRIDAISQAIRANAKTLPTSAGLPNAIDALVVTHRNLLANGLDAQRPTSLASYGLARLLRKASADLNLLNEAIETPAEPVVTGPAQWVRQTAAKARSLLSRRPDPERLLSAAKAFLAAALAAAIGEYLETKTYIGMVMVLYAFMGTAMGGTAAAAKRFVLGVTGGVAVALLSLRILAFWSSEWLMFAQLSFVLFGAGFMLTGTPGQAFVARQIAIGYCMLVLPIPQLTESLFRAERVASVLGGTAIAFIVTYALFPVTSTLKLRLSHARALVNMAEYFREIWRSASQKQRREFGLRELRARLYAESVTQIELLPQAQQRLAKDPKAAAQAAQQVEALRSACFYLVALENLLDQEDARRVLQRLPSDFQELPETVCAWATAQAALCRHEPAPEAPNVGSCGRRVAEFLDSLGDNEELRDLALPDRLLLGSIARVVQQFLDHLPKAGARPREAGAPLVPAPAAAPS